MLSTMQIHALWMGAAEASDYTWLNHISCPAGVSITNPGPADHIRKTTRSQAPHCTCRPPVHLHAELCTAKTYPHTHLCVHVLYKLKTSDTAMSMHAKINVNPSFKAFTRVAKFLCSPNLCMDIRANNILHDHHSLIHTSWDSEYSQRSQTTGPTSASCLEEPWTY